MSKECMFCSQLKLQVMWYYVVQICEMNYEVYGQLVHFPLSQEVLLTLCFSILDFYMCYHPLVYTRFG